MAWGGRRPGAGAKPKSARDRAISGVPAHRGRVLAHLPAAAPAPVEVFDAPADLLPAERVIWVALAPFACEQRTLTKATSLAFRLLCRNIVIENEMALAADARGGSDHRGMIQRVETGMLRFNVSPCGKALYEAPLTSAASVNPLEKFLRRRG